MNAKPAVRSIPKVAAVRRLTFGVMTALLATATFSGLAGGGGRSEAPMKQATPINGMLKGTIVDWPKGTPGELQLSSNDTIFATGPVDANGTFSLTLPGRQRMQHQRVLTSGHFFDQGCQGNVTVTPEDAESDHYRLDVFQNNERLGNIGLVSTAQFPMPPGSHLVWLFFHRSATRMQGRITCEHRVEQHNWHLPAGWSFAVLELIGLDKAGVDHVRFTSRPLPKNMAWRIYREYGGVGFDFDPRRQPSEALFVTNVMPGQPAEKAGLKAGDFIVEVNGRSVKGLNNRAVLDRLLGKPGSQLTLGVLRSGTNKMIRLTATRVLLKAD